MFLKRTGQNLTKKILSWIILIQIGPIFRTLMKKNVDLTTINFLNAMNSLLDKYAPFKKICKYKLKFKTKPRITFGIQKSISIKNQ